jgi:hypothetical protein
MKLKTVWIWIISAVVYLGLVIGGYTVYASMNQTDPEASDHSAPKTEHGHNDGNSSEHSEHGETSESEVETNVEYHDGLLTIHVTDQEQKPVELEVSHEKIMHLIVVSTDLSEYYHLHPEDQGNGTYTQKFDLSGNNYKAFVDIKPKNLAYHVRPIELHAGGDHTEHEKNSLQPDTNLTKTINDKTVQLTTTELEAGKNVTLTFDTKGETPEPYLGALGHVVILDENGEKFVHVHPAASDKTVFETTFAKPGIYKVWGEFRFDGKVNTYPFVIEVK